MQTLRTFEVGENKSSVYSTPKYGRLGIQVNSNPSVFDVHMEEFEGEELLAAQLAWHWREVNLGKPLVITPDPDCKACRGGGELTQRHDDYGIPETLWCDCVEEQIPEDLSDDIEIELDLSKYADSMPSGDFYMGESVVGV